MSTEDESSPGTGQMSRSSETSPPSILESWSQLTSSAEGSPARICPSLELVRAWLESGAACSFSSLGSQALYDLAGYLSRMFPDYSVLRLAEISKSFSQRWMSWGTVWRGGCLTLKTSESPSGAVASTLSDILEPHAHPRYYLSPRAARGILRRASKRGKMLPEPLLLALTHLVSTAETPSGGVSSPTLPIHSDGAQKSKGRQSEATSPSSQEPSREPRRTTETAGPSPTTTSSPTDFGPATGITDTPARGETEPTTSSPTPSESEGEIRALETPATTRHSSPSESEPEHTHPTRMTSPGRKQPTQLPQPETTDPPPLSVRRLTPTECERLQGLPDGWTLTAGDTLASETP